MSKAVSVLIVDAPGKRDRDSVARREWSRVAGASVMAIVVAAVGVFGITARPLPARGDAQARPDPQAALPSEQSVSTVEPGRTLQRLHMVIVELGRHALASVELVSRLRNDAVNQRTIVKSAEAAFENAKLAREIAEIDVVAYESGTFLQDKATAEGAIRLAKSELERARQDIEKAKARLSKIKQSSKGSAADLASEYQSEDRLTMFGHLQTKAKFEVEEAEAKLKVLIEYNKPLRIKELQSTVEKARSEELAKKATWALEQSKLIKMDASAEQSGPSLQERRVLALLDRAIPLEEKIRARMEQLASAGQADEKVSKEIRDLMSPLRALVSQAENEEAAAESARLKKKIHAATDRYPAQVAK